MKVALSNASKRVVLKWPAKAAPMAGLLPCSHQIMGKSTRYDVFMLPLKDDNITVFLFNISNRLFDPSFSKASG